LSGVPIGARLTPGEIDALARLRVALGQREDQDTAIGGKEAT
jgi:hypothetical protein